MSFHEPDSDVSRLNRSAFDGPVEVDTHTYNVLRQSNRFAVESRGVFDITVAPDLVNWGFLPRPTTPREPDPDASWRDIEMIEPNAVRFHRPLWIDLGGIAKGYAVDRAMLAMGLSDEIQCSVNAGGDLSICGPAAERVLLRAGGGGDTVPVVELENASLASSSGRDDLRMTADGPKGPHLNGASRRGAGSHSFVSVVADQCMIADGLTKIVLALGLESEAMLSHYGAVAYLQQATDPWQTIGLRL